MDTIAQIIHSLQKEEVRYYKLYTSRIQSNDRKDLKLFDHIRKSGNGYDENKIIDKLYPEGDRNAYYRLRNRIMTELNKCLLSLHFQEDEHIYLLNLLSLSKLFASRDESELALWYLRKAETKASQIENFEILDMIYSELIRVSHEALSINPEEYILKRKDNQERIRQLRSIDDITAVLSYRLKFSQTFSGDDTTVTGMLQQTIEEYSNDPNLFNSPKFKFHVYNAVSRILLTKRDYHSLEEYLIKTYNEFEKDGLFNKNNHDTKLQMLTYLVNSLFKNNKLNDSLEFASKLNVAMSDYGNLHYEKYVFFYYNALVINYSKLNKPEALNILEELRANKKLKGSPFYEIFIYLNMAILYFDLGNIRESLRNFGKLNQLPGFRKADNSLRLKISVAEMIVRFAAEDMIYLDYLIKRVRKEFKGLLLEKQFLKEKEFIQLILAMSKSVNFSQDEAIIKKISKYLNNYNKNTDEDNEVINYSQWLQEFKIKHS